MKMLLVHIEENEYGTAPKRASVTIDVSRWYQRTKPVKYDLVYEHGVWYHRYSRRELKPGFGELDTFLRDCLEGIPADTKLPKATARSKPHWSTNLGQ